MERSVVDPGTIISHRFPLTLIHQAIEAMAPRGTTRSSSILSRMSA
jgi:hypothetical protein